MKVWGTLAKIGEMDSDGRSYSPEAFKRMVDQFNKQESENPRKILGEIDMGMWSLEPHDHVSLREISHVVTALKMDGEVDDHELRGVDLGYPSAL